MVPPLSNPRELNRGHPSTAKPVKREFTNTLLQALDPDSIERLHLHPLSFEVEHELEFPGSLIEHLYFLEEGMASMTTTFKDGAQVEVGMFGYESVIGVSALMGTRRALNRVYTQIAGSGYSCPLEVARKEFDRGGLFQTLLLRYVQAQLVQVIQSAGCNAKHTFDQRLARWLLISADRARCERFKMSQQFLSEMLGSTRSTMSITAAELKQEGLIEYTRGTIHILDRASLERKACECYKVIKEHLDNYAEFDTKFAR
jgi:CRP-like cAMP-binding protein